MSRPKDQNPSLDEMRPSEHAEQQQERSGFGPDEVQRRQRDDSITGNSDQPDAAGETASPSDEPVPSVRRGALNTQYGNGSESRAAKGGEQPTEPDADRASVESPIDPDAGSGQGGAGDTLKPGGRGGS